MIVHERRILFRDRVDAGERLADALSHYESTDPIVFAIPRGGVPVAVQVADRLNASLDLVVPRKIATSMDPEAGYGAVTEDGAAVLNEPLVKHLGLTREEIERQIAHERVEITRRSAVFRRYLDAPPVEGRTAIIVDDGLASGFTMIAAINSLRQRKAARVVAAAPVASASAYDLAKPLADEVVCLAVAQLFRFAVASFYASWHDLTDSEVIKDLDERRQRRVVPGS